MGTRRLNPMRAKLNRPYTVGDIRLLYGVHASTVRQWMKDGLPVVDGRKPYVVRGRDLRDFLKHRNAKRKRPCPPDHLYCFACRQPRKPAAAKADFIPREQGAGQLKAPCEACGTAMHRRAVQATLPSILPGVVVRLVEAETRLTEPASPSLNPHFERGRPHA